MSRGFKPKDHEKRARARRQYAINRSEIDCTESSPRAAPSGITSFPVKIVDPETARMIAEFERKRGIVG